MPRKRTHKTNHQDSLDDLVQDERVSLPRIANPPVVRTIYKNRSALREIEDRRTYDPSGHARPARQFNRQHASIVSRVPKTPLRATSKFPPSLVKFDQPKKTLICVRRKIRKEVLIATRKKGYGARRRNYHSDITC